MRDRLGELFTAYRTAELRRRREMTIVTFAVLNGARVRAASSDESNL